MTVTILGVRSRHFTASLTIIGTSGNTIDGQRCSRLPNRSTAATGNASTSRRLWSSEIPTSPHFSSLTKAVFTSTVATSTSVCLIGVPIV